MSAGSFWPSPSSVAIHGARAARTPLATAALCPLRNEWRSTRSAGSELLSFCRIDRRVVGAAIVDEDHFVGAALQRGVDFARQRLDVLGFVAHRHDDREIRRSCDRLRLQRIARHAEQIS